MKTHGQSYWCVVGCRNGCNLYFFYSPFGNVTCSISHQEYFFYLLNLGWFCDLLVKRIRQMRYCASSEPVPKRPCMLPLTFFEPWAARQTIPDYLASWWVTCSQLPLFPQLTASQLSEAELSAMWVIPSWVIQPLAKPPANGRHMRRLSLDQLIQGQISRTTQPAHGLMSNEWLLF